MRFLYKILSAILFVIFSWIAISFKSKGSKKDTISKTVNNKNFK